MHAVDWVITALYIGTILGIGWAVSRRITSFRDYFVASGHMSAALLVCTIVSTYYGLDVLFGGSEVGYLDGVVGWFFYTRPYYIAVIIAALFIARRLKRHDLISLPDIAGAYFGDGTRAVVAVSSFFYSLPLLAIMGIGVLLDVLLGLPFLWGVLLGTSISIVYTLMGGLLADALTDTVQFTLMCVTLGIAAWLVLGDVGGIDGMQRLLPESYFQPRGTYPLAVLVVFGVAALSVLVEPALYQRIFAARDYRSLLIALAVGVVLWAAYDWIVTLMGMAAQALGVDVEPRYALITLTLERLPPGLTGLFVAGVVATAMSTIDSYLLICGGNLAYDLYRPLFRPDLSDRETLALTRRMIVVAGLASAFFAVTFTSIVSAWVFMSTVLVASALVPVLAGLYLPIPLKRAAGLGASLGGLGVALVFFLALWILGSEDPEWGTRIWRVTVGGRELEIWQEYGVLIALPASLVGFALGQAFGTRVGPTRGTETPAPELKTPEVSL
ncbi:MAG: sodium:solute symporter family protein [Gemmatimonadota bacterium]|nr:sodium:solute symporter family protein [Gemmatimonadota bacterium]